MKTGSMFQLVRENRICPVCMAATEDCGPGERDCIFSRREWDNLEELCDILDATSNPCVQCPHVDPEHPKAELPCEEGCRVEGEVKQYEILGDMLDDLVASMEHTAECYNRYSTIMDDELVYNF